MKAFLLFIALFGFHIGPASGETTGVTITANKLETSICVNCPSFIPLIPMIASYEDQSEVETLMEEDFLSPEIPMEADFTEEITEIVPDVPGLHPVVPKEADFQASL